MSSAEGAYQPPTPVDDLEHWLKDVRAELGNDPPGWLAPDASADESAAPDDVSTAPDDDAELPQPVRQTPGRPGRHRSPD